MDANALDKLKEALELMQEGLYEEAETIISEIIETDEKEYLHF